ncbi:MAG: PEP-utilizing enzyme [Faecalibacterium sp.]|jgi:phosphoenolpyruvate-protein kinase (PTS system EI component)|nr:PEP-utilizing enzyme [Faecalibacterium sp.]
MKVFSGVCASPGLVIAPLRRLYRASPTLSRIIEEPHQERARLEASLALAREELQNLEDTAGDQGSKDIFFFQSCLLEDEGFLDDLQACIEDGAGAACAVEQTGRKNADRLRALQDNEYMQLRAADILDACRRVVDILDGRPHRKPSLDHPVILACEMLLPSDLVNGANGMIRGAVTVQGSPQSHAAIIARSMGIPGIVRLGPDFLEDCDGHIAILDGDVGTLTLDPTPEARQDAVRRICAAQAKTDTLDAVRALPCRTRDGQPFTLWANCFGPEDISAALDAGAAGVGLVRSEYLLMQGGAPDEQAQTDFYAACLKAAGGAPVTVRTFDVGADMTTRPLADPEPNPELGLRGIRFCLAHPDLFEAQLCALLRAGHEGPLSVVLPMISCTEDWARTMSCVEHAKNSLRRRGIPFAEDLAFGITLETPAACLEASLFPPLGCRFFVLGLNDLVQYTHAADRNVSLLSPYYQTGSPAIRRLIAMSVEAASAANIPISANGLALEKPEISLMCLLQGIHQFSLTAQHILTVKQALVSADSGTLARVTSVM